MAKNKNMVFGIHAVKEAVEAGKDLDKVLVKRGSNSELQKELLTLFKQQEIPVQFVPMEKLNRLTGKNHQGVIAFLSEISYTDIENLLPMIYEKGEDPLLLILDGVSDVRNFGAIARSAECAGVDAILLPTTGSAAINADAIKTSAGALHRIPVCRERSLIGSLRFLRESGLQILAATEKASDSIYQVDMKGPIALVMGGEENGISNEVLKLADQLVRIPLKGEIASLNVSVAAGIVTFEALRQRQG